jgi:hypothetical protein
MLQAILILSVPQLPNDTMCLLTKTVAQFPEQCAMIFLVSAPVTKSATLATPM